MRIFLKNLGAIKQATFELSDLTLICGKNNTGKTYVTYALYGFLHTWQRFVTVDVPRQKINEIINVGVTKIDIAKYAKKSNDILTEACQKYTQKLSNIMATNSEYFNNTEFNIELELDIDSILHKPFVRTLHSKKSVLVSFSKTHKENILTVSLITDMDEVQLPDVIIKDSISDVISEILFDAYFPNPFIASTERTGAAIFSKELNFARNQLLQQIEVTLSILQ